MSGWTTGASAGAGPPADVPKSKPGWNTNDNMSSHLGMQRKATNMWDDKVTELIIPELEAEGEEEISRVVAAPPQVQGKISDLKDLEKDVAHNVPS